MSPGLVRYLPSAIVFYSYATSEGGGVEVEETITLYLGLKEGEKADFEIVGRAAAAFAEAVKEISYILEPSLEVRLEFDSGTEGSLKLKALLKSLNSADGRKAALISVVGTVGIMLVNDVRGYGRSPIGEFGYVMKDEKFLDDLLRGRRHLGMKQGIQITAKIETKEEFEGGVWVPRHRDIIKVVRVHREPETEDLFAQPKKAKKAKTKSRKTKKP